MYFFHYQLIHVFQFFLIVLLRLHLHKLFSKFLIYCSFNPKSLLLTFSPDFKQILLQQFSLFE